MAPAPPPRVAEPRPAAPDISTERERQRRRLEQLQAERAEQAERERERAARGRERAERARDAAKLAQARAEQEKAEQQAQDRRLAEQREANLRRMLGQAEGAAPAAPVPGRATAGNALSAAYAARIAALIRNAAVFPGSVAGNAATEVLVRTTPGGSVLARRIVKSSGSKAWDDAVLAAIDKVGTLPTDSDGRVPGEMLVAFRRHED